MSGRWTRHPLPPIQDNLQAHWLREIGDGARQGTGKHWIPVRLSLKQQGVAQMLRHFEDAMLSSGPLVLGIPSTDIRAGDETHAALLRARKIAEEPAADGHALAEIDILVAASHQEALWSGQPENTPEVRVVGIGPARPLNTFTSLPTGDPPRGEADAHLKDAKAIIAIIDDGIAFANPRFRLSDRETRIEYFYAMETLRRDKDGGDFQADFFDKADIDRWLHDHENDEESIYREAGLLDPAVDRRQPLWLSTTHGTHVLDIAAGYDVQNPDAVARARQFPIIAVQLPTLLVEDTSGSYAEPDLQMALEKVAFLARVLSRRAARQQGRPEGTLLPLIVNFSFGIFAGPKDGNSKIARHIRNFSRNYRGGHGTTPCHVVLPAGNGFQARTIGRLNLSAGEKATVGWRVLPDDRTASFLHIWLPKRSGGCDQQVSVTLIPPARRPDEEQPSKIGHYIDWQCDGAPYARVYHREVCFGSRNAEGKCEDECREHLLLALRPTATECDEPHLAPAGLWKVRIENTGGDSPLRVDIMVQRGDAIAERRRRGRQSYLESPCYQRYDPVSGRFIVVDDPDCPSIRREGSLNAYAAAPEALVVGGYRRSDGKAADYTASGPVESGREGPDLAASSESSPSHRGTLASGTYANAVRMQRGTSVAAPALVRALADEVAAGGDLDALMNRLRDHEDTPIQGPHEIYEPLTPRDRRRLGDGRLPPPDRPPHRQRIED